MNYGRCTVIFSGECGIVDVRALVPQDRDTRVQGLRGCRFLPKGSGMLFSFGMTQPVALTMVGMSISLDIIFIEGDRVTKIVHAHPGQERVEGPRRARFALEVPEGWAREFEVTVGTHVRIGPISR